MIIIKKITVIGIDQGIANCGYCVMEKTNTYEKILTMGTIKTTSEWSMGKRLNYIKEKISSLTNIYKPIVIGCEKLFFNPPQSSDNVAGFRNKSASIIYTNMSTAMIILCAYYSDIDYEEIPPPTIKKQITGYGRATKEQIEEVISEQFDEFLFDELLIVKKEDSLIFYEEIRQKRDEHTFDAVSIALTVARKHFDEKSK